MLATRRSGYVCEAVDVDSQARVTLKLDRNDTRRDSLEQEADIYRKLAAKSLSSQSSTEYPKIHYLGDIAEYKVLVMSPRMGTSIEALQKKFLGSVMPVESLPQIGIHIIDRLMDLHSLGLVHGGLKPSNLFAGGGQSSTWHLVNLDSSCSYRDLKSEQNLPIQASCGFRGPELYASVSAHERCTITRKSDLESPGYVLIHLLQGSLPRGRIDDWWLQLHEDETGHLMWKIMKSGLVSSEYAERLPLNLRIFFVTVNITKH